MNYSRFLDKAKDALSKGYRITAIKHYRSYAGCGLREALDVVEGIRAGSREWPKPEEPVVSFERTVEQHKDETIAALVAALIEARAQLVAYELDASGENYNNLQINAALELAGVAP